MHKMHKDHVKAETTHEDALRALAAGLPPTYKLSWRARAAIWGLVGLMFGTLAGGLGAAIGFLAWLVWWFAFEDPNFWLCWGGATAPIAAYLLFNYWRGDARPEKP